MKKIVEVTCENEAHRKFGVTARIAMPEKGYWAAYDKESELPEDTLALVRALMTIESVKEVSIWPGEVNVTVKLAWADEEGWRIASAEILKVLNEGLFNGEASTELRRHVPQRRSMWGY